MAWGVVRFSFCSVRWAADCLGFFSYGAVWCGLCVCPFIFICGAIVPYYVLSYGEVDLVKEK